LEEMKIKDVKCVIKFLYKSGTGVFSGVIIYLFSGVIIIAVII